MQPIRIMEENDISATAEKMTPFDYEGLTEQYLIPWGANIGFALLILIVGIIVSKWIVNLARHGMRHAKFDDMLIDFVTSLLKWLLYFIFIIASLNRLGVPTTSFIAVLGAAGLAIGLALKDSLQNFAAGVMLIMFRPFKTGDSIEAGGASGVVEDVQIFSTTMRTADNREIVLPNGDIFSCKITNNSARDTRRIDLVVAIGYNDDLREAKRTLEQVINAEDRILAEPEPLVAVGELGASSVDILVRPWVKTPDFFAAKCALTENIKLALDDAGISMPFPQMDIHVDQDPSGPSVSPKMD